MLEMPPDFFPFHFSLPFFFSLYFFLFFFFIFFFQNFGQLSKMSQEVFGIVDRSDMWASAIALREEWMQDISYARRYESMLSFGHTNEGPTIYFANNSISRLQPESFVQVPEAWTDRFTPDPWVDQLLLSCKVRALPFKVPLSATLREALQLLPGEGRPL